MQLTELSTALALILAVAALAVALIAYRGSRKSVENVVSLAQWTRENSSKSLSLKRIAQLEADMTDLQESYDTLLGSMKKLRAKIHLRMAREKRHPGSDEPNDLHSETDKNALRLNAKGAGLLR